MIRLKKVNLQKRSLRSYRPFLSSAEAKEIRELSSALAGQRVIHVNATPIGGGVAEMLKALVPLQRAVGLRAEWLAIEAPKRFFVVTKEIHNALQGKRFSLEQPDLDMYLSVNRKLAQGVSQPDCDLAVIHDPQPMPLVGSYRRKPMVLRIHIDLSSPNRKILHFLKPFFGAYEKVIFSSSSFIPRGLSKNRVAIIAPAIDPLDSKNRSLSCAKASKILQDVGIDPRRPFMAQVSRFDPWKNPLGVVEAYRRATKVIPDLQLALVGIRRAQDDPEAEEVFREVQRQTQGDKDVFLFSDIKELKGHKNEVFVNAVQSTADAILQLSTREGFGLTVTEAMWKGAAVVGGSASGIRSQITNGVDGFIAKNPKVAAKRVVELVKDKALRCKIGRQAKRTVYRKFLVTRQLLDHLRLYKEVLES